MFSVQVFIALSCILAGIGLIAATFLVQKKEDETRMPGYYTTATVTQIRPCKNNSELAVTFEFTKDFKIRQVTNSYGTEEAGNLVTGRSSLIVFDEAQGRVYVNPMKASRQKQAVMIIVGFLVLLFGLSWLYFSFTLLS